MFAQVNQLLSQLANISDKAEFDGILAPHDPVFTKMQHAQAAIACIILTLYDQNLGDYSALDSATRAVDSMQSQGSGLESGGYRGELEKNYLFDFSNIDNPKTHLTPTEQKEIQAKAIQSVKDAFQHANLDKLLKEPQYGAIATAIKEHVFTVQELKNQIKIEMGLGGGETSSKKISPEKQAALSEAAKALAKPIFESAEKKLMTDVLINLNHDLSSNSPGSNSPSAQRKSRPFSMFEKHAHEDTQKHLFPVEQQRTEEHKQAITNIQEQINGAGKALNDHYSPPVETQKATGGMSGLRD